MNKLLPLLLALALVPFALAHTGTTDYSGAEAIPTPNTACWPHQNPHDYTVTGNHDVDVMGRSGGFGYSVNWDGNTEDCDFDGQPETDQDFEWGNGGGFFPAGPWATVCGYNSHHSDNVHVHDAIYQPNDGTGLHEAMSFTVGADPSPPTIVTTPPATVTNPIDGSETVILVGGDSCVDDGCICVSDLDPDDWLKTCKHKCDLSPPADNTNPSFGQPGGDGGYWVYVNCNVETNGSLWEGTLITITDENDDGLHDNVQIADTTPPTTAGAGCSETGHIYFPNTWPGKTS